MFTEKCKFYSTQHDEIWEQLAIGDGTHERVFAVCLGYGVFGLGLVIYMNILNMGAVRTAGRAVRAAVRQQLLIVKVSSLIYLTWLNTYKDTQVAAFIVIELFIFPLGCGINLDACSIWMFPEATIETRIAFFKYAPLTSIFYHWVLGTMFMYETLLSGPRILTEMNSGTNLPFSSLVRVL
jgi:E3 ubiquitin-protein ligase MARCH6